MNLPEQYATWKGVPREEIDWHPDIDEEKCKGCGMVRNKLWKKGV